MTTFKSGRQAEAVAARYLEDLGYIIIEQNWRTRWCEVDIIAKKEKIIHFVEVKFRLNDDWGSGLNYITSRKLKQMQYAAEFWMHSNHWPGDSTLSAIEVTGSAYNVTAFLPFLEESV